MKIDFASCIAEVCGIITLKVLKQNLDVRKTFLAIAFLETSKPLSQGIRNFRKM
jgi:hypothetical protein